MKHSLLILLVPWILLACAVSLRGQEPVVADDQRSIDDLSPDGRFAFLRLRQSDPEPQRTCDLIEKTSGKILLRVAASDVGQDRLDTRVLWSADSQRFALFTTYNHFGADLSVYLRAHGVFRKLTLPDFSVPEIPGRLERGHEWKWTGMNAASAENWRKDGTLAVRSESTLYEINGFLILTSRRDVVLGFGKSGKVAILKSRQKVFAHDERD